MGIKKLMKALMKRIGNNMALTAFISPTRISTVNPWVDELKPKNLKKKPNIKENRK